MPAQAISASHVHRGRCFAFLSSDSLSQLSCGKTVLDFLFLSILIAQVAHNLLVAGDKTGAGTLCDMGNCRKVAQIAAHKGAVRSLDIAGEFLMTGGM